MVNYINLIFLACTLLLLIVQAVTLLSRLNLLKRKVFYVILEATGDFTFILLLAAHALWVTTSGGYNPRDAYYLAPSCVYMLLVATSAYRNHRNCPKSTGVTLTSANLQFTNHLTSEALKNLTSGDPDYIVTIETSEQALVSIQTNLKNYLQVTSGSGARGSMVVIWAHSRVMRSVSAQTAISLKASTNSLPAASISVNGKNVTLVGVHLSAPITNTHLEIWGNELNELKEHAQKHEGGLVFAGDFNASLYHRELNSLAQMCPDAAKTRGVHRSHTWPQDGGMFSILLPWAVMGLDHVLCSPDVQVLAYSEISVHGSDHKATRCTLG